MNIETRLARISMNKIDSRDAEKTYHRMSLREIERLAPDFNWKQYLKETGVPPVPYFIVSQPQFIRKAARLFKSLPLEEAKTYLEWHLLNDAASLLSPKFIRAQFDFYGTTLTGTKKMQPVWRRSLRAVNNVLGEALGKLYVDKHFGPAAKKRMERLVADLFAAYAERIRNLDWMSSATKKKALTKLAKMNSKIGYPARFRSYKGLEISPNDYFGNMLRASEFEHRREMNRLKKPVDRKEWFMTPQTVNAYCHFNLNEIVFPAAILQPPFFFVSGDDAVNYGAIGSTIGHEISHGFDDQGSKFDGDGNMKGWWTARDKKRFKQKASVLVRHFNAYTVAGGVPVNGKLTLGENIADLGGLSIAFDAFRNRLKKTSRKNIDGFTPEQRFFLGWAAQECEAARPEFEKTSTLTDPHSPNRFRVNGPASNFEEFYKAFDVKKGDRLYREPKLRAKVW